MLGIITATRSPFGDPELPLQISGERARKTIGVGIGQRLAEAAECRLSA